MDDQLIAFGGEIKALEGNRVGGYLVRFTDEDNPDVTGDFFTKSTDFDIAEQDHPITVYYHHGQNKTLGNRKLGRGTLRVDDVGVWIEAELELRDSYERAISEHLVMAGKAGWSSGAVAHLVQRTQVKNGVWNITDWPIGEASITPTPAAGIQLTQVTTLKSLDLETDILEASGTDATDHVEDETDSALEEQTIDEGAQEEAPQVKTDMEPKEETVQEQEQQEEFTPAVKSALAKLEAEIAELKAQPAPYKAGSVNYNNKTKLGDDETKAYAYYVRTGDEGAIKASNDTDMNIGTAADGGNAVPTGHYQGIIARRDESRLSAQLGVRMIPGTGTTVNVPIDSEADGEFISTAEAAEADRDAPALGTVAMTLAKYTKRVELSHELLQDEDSRLMAFLSDFVGRGMAKTHNSLLIAEVGSNGTSFDTFASNSAIAAGEVENLESNDDLGAYLDDTSSVAFVTRNSTLAAIRSITGNERMYADEAVGGPNVAMNRTLLGYPVLRSNQVAAMGTTAKSLYFGNWNYVGLREAPSFTVLRDPYSKAKEGQIVLHYYFRAVYKVLQAEAIGYGVHPV